MSFELLSLNLYEFLRDRNFQGLSMGLIRRFAIQMLHGLAFLHDHRIIHCDLKPENVLLRQPNKSGIKLIDLGSSCFEHEKVYTYIQSRFYRAPEIMLGIPYTTAIDMWSFGCIIAELFTGFPLFPGESEKEQFSLILELRGLPPKSMLMTATRQKVFFDHSNNPLMELDSKGRFHVPGSRTLQQKLKTSEEHFLQFLSVLPPSSPRSAVLTGILSLAPLLRKR
jgi:dual specificity tyrosine-phosphorylation-regulated kinase 2/3/4